MCLVARSQVVRRSRISALSGTLLLALAVAASSSGHAVAAPTRAAAKTAARGDAPAERDRDATPAPLPLRSAADPRFAETERGCPDGRIRAYLDRHGDFGLIDPEALLEMTRQVKAERERDVHAFAIGGTAWTSLGPTNGAGRATAIAAHPTVAGTAIIGAAGGGAWKTTDSGATWTPLTDSIPNLSVGAIAIAPSNPSIVYLGTGEGGFAIDFIPGIGLLSSSDGGATWNLPSSVIATQFFKISVNPANANELVAGTNAGALRSTNGQSGPWTSVIPTASGPGVQAWGYVTDLVRDPTNAQILYAAVWDGEAWCQRYGCSDPYSFGSPTILKSTDGGQTWNPANTNLPVSNFSQRVDRWSIALAPSSPQTLYAATAIYDSTFGTEVSHVYKSVNGGGTWSETTLSASSNYSISHYLGNQVWYDNTIVVAPTDPNTVLVGGVHYVKTIDGGTTWTVPPFTGSYPHTDVHELRYDAGGTLIIGNDGGIWTSPDSGATGVDRNTNLVTRQFYALASDAANRNRMFAGAQDNGTTRRPDTGGTAWDFFTGGDGIQCGINPTTPSVVYSTYQYAQVNRSFNAGAAAPTIASITPPFDTSDQTPFLSGFVVDPNNPTTVYTFTHRLWRSTSGGDAWQPLPITTTDGSFWRTDANLTAMAIARSDSTVIMAAQYGTVFRSTNGGTTWVSASTGLPGRSVNSLEIDPHNPLIAYASLAGMSGTSVYMTTNGGVSWTPRGTGLPAFSAQVVRVDPTDSNTLYCGTDVGVYRSIDDGATWTRFGSGLPAVSVYDISILADGSILRAATHGRGTWALTVTGNTNQQPVATITAPLSAQTVARGSVLTFSGSISDPDGNPITGVWSFPDTWQSRPAAAGASSVTHEFDRAGIFPVTLAVTDSHGAIGTASINVTVPEPADDCASAIVIPPAGPFPWSTVVNTSGSTLQASDPTIGGSCYPYTIATSVWLSFTPASTGTYQFSACGSSSSAIILGYTGNACGPYTPNSLCYTNLYPSRDCTSDPVASVALTAGVPIRLLVSPYFYSDSGAIVVTVTQNSVFSPAIQSVVPAVGPGGTTVTVTGSGFASGATVSFGGVAATGVTLVTSSILTANAPAHAPGAVDVVVANSGGASATAGRSFTYSGSASTTALAATVNPSTYGQPVTFTATITPIAATGSVTFKDGSTSLGSAPVAAGVAALVVSSLGGGTHSITATYSGDSTYGSSSSAPLTETVNPAATTTTLLSSVNPSNGGQSVTFTANVTPSAATGSVTFKDGTTTLGSGTVGSGSASFSTAALAAGSHSISAAYGGDTNYSASTSLVLTQVVGTVTHPHGDANGDGQVTAADVFYLINYLFTGGAAPVGPSDVNGDGVVNVADIFYLINYLFAGGAAPR